MNEQNKNGLSDAEKLKHLAGLLCYNWQRLDELRAWQCAIVERMMAKGEDFAGKNTLLLSDIEQTESFLLVSKAEREKTAKMFGFDETKPGQ